MIKYSVLGSGSSGNSVYFNVDGNHFLIDCGFSKKELNRRLNLIGRSTEDIRACLISHHHGDHFKKWVEKEGWLRNRVNNIVTPFLLNHDSECYGHVIQDHHGHKVGIISDTGCVPEEALKHLWHCSALLIETNYDVDLLVNGKYSTEQQERISSDTGHLMNEDAAAVVECLAWPGLEQVVGMHMSANNNRPELVRFCLQTALHREAPGCEVVISEQAGPTKIKVII